MSKINPMQMARLMAKPLFHGLTGNRNAPDSFSRTLVSTRPERPKKIVLTLDDEKKRARKRAAKDKKKAGRKLASIARRVGRK